MKYNPFEDARRFKLLNDLRKRNHSLKEDLCEARNKISRLELMVQGLTAISNEYERLRDKYEPKQNPLTPEQYKKEVMCDPWIVERKE